MMAYAQDTARVTLLGLLTAGLYAWSVVEGVVHQRGGLSSSPRRFEQSSFAALHATSRAAEKAHAESNPFLVAPYADFIKRFDIPTVHGSGVYVDLSNVKTVDGKSYREPAGKCPVFGKYIQLHQPENNPTYKNNFLADVPTAQQSRAAGNPLPGGFNNNFKLQDGTAYSPMPLSRLKSYSKLTAKSGLGKCAQMAYMTTAGKNSEYRYPFVYDTKEEVCYFLLVSMQRLMGERYCSNNNVPPGMTWYCFEPKKDAAVNSHLVYGSPYVGAEPDAWEEKCPNKAVKKAVFGVWQDGQCVAHRELVGADIRKVESKEQCWELVFSNPGVASDHPISDSENIGTVGYYFPTATENQPKSGGEGVNYASYYGGSQKECVLSNRIPTCFVPKDIGVAYTSLGSIEEQPLPACPDGFPEFKGACDFSTCTATVVRCVQGEFVHEATSCTPEEASKCSEKGSGLVVGLAVGGVAVLILLGAGGFFFFRRKPAEAAPSGPVRKDYVQDEAASHRRKQRQSDLVQQAEPSFWEEAADAPPESAAENTQVLIDQDY
ncbi:hypothetical protein Efla_002232 [Eimeria flavescens]